MMVLSIMLIMAIMVMIQMIVMHGEYDDVDSLYIK